MHAAPSVSYPVGRSRFAAGLLSLLWLAGLAAVVAWTLSEPAAGWRQGLALVLVLACGLFALAAWRRSPAGTLAWDGGAWNFAERGQRPGGRIELRIDLQARLLLAWVPAQGRTRHLWLERNAAPERWDALRRAVYSRANNDAAPHGATSPVAER